MTEAMVSNFMLITSPLNVAWITIKFKLAEAIGNLGIWCNLLSLANTGDKVTNVSGMTIAILRANYLKIWEAK